MSTLSVQNIESVSSLTVSGTVDMGSSFLRNKIINGDMRIDQRYSGTSFTSAGYNYTLDRWVSSNSQTSKYTVQRNAGSVTPPTGFTNYLGITSTSAYTLLASDYFYIAQHIEGFNVSDLGFGTAQAQSITISFWARSSLTGTFGGSIFNSAINRIYNFSYTLTAANTWQYITITIPGDTTGTWLTDNSIGLTLAFSLGVGTNSQRAAGSWGTTGGGPTGANNIVSTNGATWYVTGVQIEAGTTATPFERRLYGQELALCQRYYNRLVARGVGEDYAIGYVNSATNAILHIWFPTTMRVGPTTLEQSGTASDYSIRTSAATTTCSAVPTFYSSSTNSASVVFTVASGLTAGQGCGGRPNGTNGYLGWNAEL